MTHGASPRRRPSGEGSLECPTTESVSRLTPSRGDRPLRRLERFPSWSQYRGSSALAFFEVVTCVKGTGDAPIAQAAPLAVGRRSAGPALQRQLLVPRARRRRRANLSKVESGVWSLPGRTAGFAADMREESRRCI